MRNSFLACLLFSVLCFSVSTACAAPAVQPAPAQDKPAKVDARVTPVEVVHEGTDSIGARLGTRLKETFNTSSLFRLTEKDAPKLRLLLSTQSEFSGRPSVGSVYSVCWVFSQGQGYLSFLLGREVGTVSTEDIEGLVARIVERTDGISVKYGDILKDKK